MLHISLFLFRSYFIISMVPLYLRIGYKYCITCFMLHKLFVFEFLNFTNYIQHEAQVIFMPPTLEKLEGHIVFGLSVRE